MKYSVYLPGSGEILRSGEATTEEGALMQARTGEAVLLNFELDDRYFHVEDGQPAMRTEIECADHFEIAADGKDEVVIVLPQGTEIRFEGTSTPDQGDLVFTSDKPGVYVIELVPPFPFQPKEVTIHAN